MAYANNHPPLPALASGTSEAPTQNIAAGAPLNYQDLIDARNQHKTRKLMNEFDPPLATDAEVIDSKRRKLSLEVDHFAPGGIVALTNTVNNLANTVNNLVSTVNNLVSTVNDPVTGLAALSHRLDTQEARNINRTSVRRSMDPTVPVPNATGEQPPAWFGTISFYEIGDLRVAPANNQGLDDIMGFYGVPIVAGQTQIEKIAIVKGLLGITF